MLLNDCTPMHASHSNVVASRLWIKPGILASLWVAGKPNRCPGMHEGCGPAKGLKLRTDEVEHRLRIGLLVMDMSSSYS
eukprot:scaffold118732_cov23-Prasinocladus_malaysianus.AAC.1